MAISNLPYEPNSARIMVVEDPFVSSFLGSLLTKHGYQVVFAAGPQGLDLLRTGEATPDLLVTNQPAIFAAVGDSLPLLYLAAFPEPEQASAFPICGTLRKPFQPRQLLEAVQDLVECGMAVR